MKDTKVYLAAFFVRFMYALFQIFCKAAFNGGMGIFVFVFYRQALATLFLAPIAFLVERKRAPPLSYRVCFKMFIHALYGISVTLITSCMALDYTSATLTSAAINALPVVTFIVAVLLRVETIMLKKLSGIMKASGVVLCLAGTVTMALYKGPHLKSLNNHHLLGNGSGQTDHPRRHLNKLWILGTFLMIIANITWSLWMILQAPLLEEYPSKLLFTTLQSLFSAVQLFVVAMAFQRDFSQWKLGWDMGLVSVAFGGIIITGVTFYLQSWIIEKRGPVFLAMSTPLTLIFTIACSSFLLGELINLGSVLGGTLMVGGLYCFLWGQKKEQRDGSISTSKDTMACSKDKEMSPPNS